MNLNILESSHPFGLLLLFFYLGEILLFIKSDNHFHTHLTVIEHTPYFILSHQFPSFILKPF